MLQKLEDVFDKVDYATTFKTRLVGLLGREDIEHGYALVFPKCSSVHCAFMRCTIDVVYLSDKGEVLGVEQLAPWKLGKSPRGTKHVLECREHETEVLGIHIGTTFDISNI